MFQKTKLSGKVVTKSTTKPKELSTDEFDLKVRLLALKYKYENIGDTYEETAFLMKSEFGIDVNPRDLWLLDEMNIQEESEDRKLIWQTQTNSK